MEAAVVIPILFLLVFGIIDFGFVFNDTVSVRHGAREAARSGVVGTFGSNTTCTNVGASGANASTKALICTAKDRTGLDHNKTRVKIALGTGGYAAGEPLVVCIQYQLTSVSGVFSTLLTNKVFDTEVQMRIEELETSPPLTAAEETSLAGGSWAFCAAS